MKVSFDRLYCYIKKLLRPKHEDHWDNNPFVIL
jgi:hypothetical protein